MNRYKRTGIKALKNMNEQNAHVSLCYEVANFALLKLVKMNITVLRLVIEDKHPVIEIAKGRQNEKLNGLVYATVSEGGGRKHIKRALVNSCIVQWETNELH